MSVPSSICRTRRHPGGGVTADEMREMQWVRPELVAQIRFVEWTAEGRLRHAAFLGLRSDKSAREVRREANESH
jgi:bifunctional non-homologous end joining protein LigD